MRIASLLTVPALFFSAQLRSQDDPFAGNYRVGPSEEIALIITPGDPESGAADVFLKVFDANGTIDNGWLEVANGTLAGASPVSDPETDPGTLDAVGGDFNGDGLDEVVFAYEGANREVILYFPDLKGSNLIGAQAIRFNMLSDGALPALADSNDREASRFIRLIAGEFDGDEGEELALGWVAETGVLQLAIVDIEASPRVVASIAAEGLDPFSNGFRSTRESSRFDLIAGDFNDNGRDELMLLAARPSESLGWGLEAEVYAVSEGETGLEITLEGNTSEPIESVPPNNNDTLLRMAAGAGDFNGDAFDEVFLTYQISPINAASFVTYRRILTVETDLSSVSPLGNRSFIEGSSGSDGFPLGVYISDQGRDGRDDIAYGHRQGVRLYTADGDLNLTQQGGSVSMPRVQEQNDHRILLVTDLDADESETFEPEVVTAGVVETSEGYAVSLRAYRMGQFEPLAEVMIPVASKNDPPRVAIARLDLDNDSLQLGPPRLTRRTDIVQPLIILNAPPVHFDVFEGVTFDVNECYGEAPCASEAIYINSQSQQFEVSTTISADWGFSRELTGEVETGIGIGPFATFFRQRLSTSLTERYGEGFSNTEGFSRTFTVTSTTSAIEDDLIYASVIDYDIYEYPAFGNGEFQGYVSVVVPQPAQPTWFPAKDNRGQAYISPHEVGNILSYPATIETAENPIVGQPLRSFEGDRWTMSNSSTQQWRLEFSEIESSDRERSSSQSINRRTEYEVEVGGTVPLAKGLTGDFSFRFEGAVEGTYNRDQISTHRTVLASERSVEVNLGTIDGGILGSQTWDVTPFLYWSTDGALVLDYAVNPAVGGPTQSWWESNYSKPDLAFVLPWRNDEEKGFGGPDIASLRELTRHIQVDPFAPEGDDVVTLFAEVRNFSVGPANSPVTSLRFYLGDPRNGGSLITNTDGQSEITVPPIPPRGEVVLALPRWQVPPGLPSDTRIYAVLDPAEGVDEVHEDNNIAWNLLGSPGRSIWAGADDIGGGARRYGWFGDFFPFTEETIYHFEHGYLFTPSTQLDSLWFFDYRPELGWFWTSDNFYPFLWSFGRGAWLYYYPVGGGFFYDYGIEDNIFLPPIL